MFLHHQLLQNTRSIWSITNTRKKRPTTNWGVLEMIL